MEFHTFVHLTQKNALMHTLGMDYPKVLRALMAAWKVNQSLLAKRLGVAQPTVSRWLKGKTKPNLDQHQRIIAEASSVGIIDAESAEFDAVSIAENPPPPVVRIVGYVGAGATAHFYAVAQGELDEVAAPEATTTETVAVEIRGNSLGELFDRWLIFYDDVRRPVTSDLIGHLCVVGLADERVLVKKIRRARGNFFDLHSNTEEPMRSVAIEWAARVKLMVPR